MKNWRNIQFAFLNELAVRQLVLSRREVKREICFKIAR
jgi:hypothetical protein